MYCKLSSVRRGKHTQEVDAKGTSIECFNCGERVIKDLSVRVHNCPNCGVSLDRDLNASLNVLKRTVGQPFAACGGKRGCTADEARTLICEFEKPPLYRLRLAVGVVTTRIL
uniref:zinc ribbon domain-containing protein n=1 Tax=Microseira wollei TaxID=467598 RepID=UPI0027D949C1|nr:zinc ribbon domain-containing protein [Microseira wollei]